MGVKPVGDIYKSFTLGKEGEPGRLYSTSFGVYITGEGVFNAPERDGEMITIPGRNGELFKDNGTFKNITLTYKAGMSADTMEELAEGIRNFRNQLLKRSNSYQPLYDDYNTDEYRMALYRNGLEVIPKTYGKAAEFDIVFDCKPQRFLKTGDVERTWTASGQLITNPTGWDALPIIKFTMTGTSGVISLGDNGSRGVININGAPLNTQIIVDCEIGESYTGSVGMPTASMNAYVDIGAKIPYLGGGSTNITYTTNVTNLKVTPRWWRV